MKTYICSAIIIIYTLFIIFFGRLEFVFFKNIPQLLIVIKFILLKNRAIVTAARRIERLTVLNY